MVSVRRDKALRSFWGLLMPMCCAGVLKDAMKVQVTREASIWAHSSSDGSHRGAPANGEGFRGAASLEAVGG
jgi:hypothetical protein